MPSRSASFSQQPHNSSSSSYFASAMRDRAFNSTVDEDDEDVDDPDDYAFVGRGFNERGRPFPGNEGGSEWSRSRSQSLATTGSRVIPGTGSAYASWNEGLLSGSNSLHVPGTLGRWSATSNHNPTDISNQSPFVRDVGQILLEESSQFKHLWNNSNQQQRDEILGPSFVRNPFGAIGGGFGAADRGGYGYGGGGMGSGTSSRRHSVSVVQPRRGVQVGFDADESGYSGNSGGGGGAGAGGLLLSDEDLLGSGMGMLSLNSRLDAHLQSQDPSASSPGSVPIYAPISRSPSSFRQIHEDRTPSDRESQQQQHYFPTQPAQPQQQVNEGSYATRARTASQSGGLASPVSPTNARSGFGIQQGFYSQQTPQQSQQPQHAPQQPPQHHQHIRQPSNNLGGQHESTENALGKGIPLASVPSNWPLFIVEFKAGRTDLFYLKASEEIKIGDLVIVEADRGRDLGRIVNDSITVHEVERWLESKEPGGGGQWGDQPMSPGGGAVGAKKEINPKMIYGKAGPQEASQFAAKMQDEAKALQLCQSKVRAKKLPMEVVDAEYQWDRRKLTFYFVAEKRIDFRELVRELFRLYKTRIWMASLQSGGIGGGFQV